MKVAVAGLGWWGKQIIACLDRSPRFEVLYGIDPKPPADVEEFRKSHKFTLDTTLDRALADPAIQGVVLATPHELHEEQSLRVIAAGKNLFCEKPLTMTGAGAKRVVEAARKAGKVLGVGHERRWEPAFEELRKLVDAGTLGKLLFFETNASHDNFRRLAKDNWRLSTSSAPAGMMTAVGIHHTDLFINIAGPAAEVRAQSTSMIFEPPAVYGECSTGARQALDDRSRRPAQVALRDRRAPLCVADRVRGNGRSLLAVGPDGD